MRLTRRSSYAVTVGVVTALIVPVGAGAAAAAPARAASAVAVSPALLAAPALPSSAPAPETPAADGELVSMRTQTSDTYAVPGSPGALRLHSQLGTPLNYRDAQGVWQKIDDTLLPDGGTAGGWHVAADSYTADLPATLAAPVTVAHDGQTLQMTVVGAAGTATVSGATVTYANALPGVTIAYTATPTGLHEVITLASAAAAAKSLSFELTIPAGDRMTTTATGTTVTSATGTTEFTIPASWAQGATDHEPSFAAVTRTLGSLLPVAAAAGTTTGAQTVTLTDTLDPAWAAAAGRTWPVVMDPDISTITAFTPSDCLLVQNAPSSSFCGSTTDEVGYDSDGYGVRRTLVNVSTGQVPIGANVLAAELYFTQKQVAGSQPTVLVTQNCNNWNPNAATWNTNGIGTTWAGGSPCNPAVYSGGYCVCGSSTIYTLGFTGLFRSWLDGTIPNQGLILTASNESAVAHALLYSTHSSTQPLAADVVYQPRVGTDASSTFTNYPLTGHATAQVDVTSGNLLLATTDLSVASKGIPFSAEHDYNSMTAAHENGEPYYDWGSLGAGWTSSVIDPNGASLANSVGQWNSVDPTRSGEATPLTYSANPYTAATSIISPPGRNLTNAYAASSNTTGELTDASSGLTQNLSTGSTFKLIDPHGNTETITHTTPSGGPTGASTDTDTQGRSYTFTADGNGLITGMTDVNGSRSVAYSHNASEQLTGFNDANTTTGYVYAYYPTSKLLMTVTTPGGRQTSFTYDNWNRISTVAETVVDCAHPSGASQTYTYAYPTVDNGAPAGGAAQAETTVTDPLGHVTKYYLDGRHAVIQTTDANGHNQQTGYDPSTGLTMKLTNALNQVTTLNYTNRDLTSVSGGSAGSNPDGSAQSATTTYAGYSTGARHVPGMTTDPQGNTTMIGTTGSDITDVTSAAPSSSNTHFTYNSDGTVATSRTPNNGTTTYSYTSGNLTQILPPSVPAGIGNAAITISPDADSRPVKVTDGRGDLTTTTYDNLDRITKVLYADNTYLTYGYDKDDNLTSRRDRDGMTSTFAFDVRDRPTSQVDRNGATYTTCWNTDNSVANVTDAGGQTTYGYTGDNAGNATSVQQPGGNCASYTFYGTPAMPAANSKCVIIRYDAGNRVDKLGYPGGTVKTTTYGGDGQVNEITVKTSGGTNLTDRKYTYLKAKPAGGGNYNDTSLVQTASDVLSNRTASYTYDEQNRLTAANGQFTDTSNTQNYSYTYDLDGNLTKSTIGTNTPTWATYDARDRTCWTYQTTSNPGTSCATPSGATAYQYDSAGNLASAGAFHASYDAAGNMTNATDSSGNNNTTYTYSDANSVLRLTAGTTTYTNSILGTATKTTAGTTTAYGHLPAGTTLSQTTNGTSTYLVTDRQGSTIESLDDTGAHLDYDYYDPTGNRTYGSHADYTFHGLAQDPNGLYKTGLRYLNPGNGRFTQLDPTHKDDRAYAYAENNPITLTDATGADAVDDYFNNLGNYGGVGVIAGAGIGCAAGVLIAVLPGCVAAGAVGGIIGGVVGVVGYGIKSLFD